jgi:hypothetical protein
MKMRIGPLMAAITCTVAISSAYADGDVKYPPLLNSQWVDWRVKYGRQPGEANT